MYKILFCIVVGLCLTGGAYGSMKVVDLPATDTDAAIGISPDKTYTHTIDFGNNAPAVVNGVSFVQGPTETFREPFVDVSAQGYRYVIDDSRAPDYFSISPYGGGDVDPCDYADGNSVELLVDMIYYSKADKEEYVGESLIITLQDLVPGTQYSVRYYYRPWDTDPNKIRPLTVTADGGESIDIDTEDPGAHYLDYTFVADDNDVTLDFAYTEFAQGAHIYGLTCEVVPRMTIVDLPATDTDAAIGIDPNKTYTHAIDFGKNAPAVVNGLAFDQGPTSNLNALFVGVSSQGYGYIIDDSRAPGKFDIKPHGGNDPCAVADGGSADMLRDMIYYSSAKNYEGEGILITLTDLVSGTKYSVRYYYRTWDVDSPRPVTITGDGAKDGAFVDVLNIDIDAPGAHYLDYTFVADDNDVTIFFAYQDYNQGAHIYGLTCEIVWPMTVVDLPATDTDVATGIDPNKTYTHAIDFGTDTPAVINGVAFDAGPLGKIREAYAGVTSQGYGYVIDDSRAPDYFYISSHRDGDDADGVDPNSATNQMMKGLLYYSNAKNYEGEGILFTLLDLVPGTKYSVRYYYRTWDGDSPRPLTISADSGGSIDIDIDGPGAHYLDYTFIANDSDLALTFAYHEYNQGAHLYGLTCEVVE